ncbi:5-formyltetrahydrofolate cyclo-ligase isoform X1 [Hemitrygon akajei]|uniref:5-formyltetrahydrofolate cyclo-ligase isoform X1 n=1 Tax=Hemitrygon akajei TaxID=2704970 RepID=UPI003BF9FAF4
MDCHGNMAALRAAKKALRLEMKRRVAALSDTEKHRQSVAVSRRLLAHPKYQNCQRIAVFLSMSDEIQTEDIIKDVFQSSKECFIPRYKTGSNRMDMVKLSSVEEICNLPVTSWNIQQPAEDDLLEDALNTGSLSLGPPYRLGLHLQGQCCSGNMRGAINTPRWSRGFTYYMRTPSMPTWSYLMGGRTRSPSATWRPQEQQTTTPNNPRSLKKAIGGTAPPSVSRMSYGGLLLLTALFQQIKAYILPHVSESY